MLVFAALRFSDETSPSSAVAFVVGTACGFVGPFVLRLGHVLGRERVQSLTWLRRAGLIVFFLPLLVAASSYAFVATGTARSFALGTLATFFLGVALVPETRTDRED